MSGRAGRPRRTEHGRGSGGGGQAAVTGKLRVFLGAAPGVGKTYAMLR
ncbi:hypothetical protein, partial [Kitasatospora aureofaciens]